ncbi:hypothetical protein GQ54DRAFT_300695 [Martensiomyces pterosporus]|nr:hypothetical protein GQ54DRAFT_300695 [Martensiomyces pterosporus]
MLPTQPPTADTHTLKQVPRKSTNTHHSRLCSHTLVLSWFARKRACCWNSRANCQIGAPLLLNAPVLAAAVFRWRVLLQQAPSSHVDAIAE